MQRSSSFITQTLPKKKKRKEKGKKEEKKMLLQIACKMKYWDPHTHTVLPTTPAAAQPPETSWEKSD